MKTRNEEMKVNILALAIRCALMAGIALPLTAHADEAEAYALTHPSNTVGFGALYSSQDSAKFGQYNGLNKEGAYGIGNFDIRGGDGYDADKNSALRWKLNGADLGTTNRTLGGSISDQGKWKLGAGYDELRHNITDTYQTPLQGNPGENNFTLPGNFGKINGSAAPGTNSLTPNQLNAFHTEQEYTERRNGQASGAYTFSEQFNAQFDYNHIDQNGAKLIGTGSQGGIAPGQREAVNIIMNPTNYTTDNINTALNWTGDKGHLSGGYYGSMFYDKYNSLSWQNGIGSSSAACVGTACFTNNTMSTAPSNSLHQANLSGGYNFSSATKLAGGFSYSYNSQNSSYAPTNIVQPNGVASNMMWGGLPSSSLNGQVATTHGDLKLTNQSIKDLTLSTGFKFNERDNYTNSEIYNYKNLANNSASLNPAINGSLYTGVNTPYSNSKAQFEAAADYRLTNKQKLRLAYERENIKRWCNQVVGGAQCIATPSSNEDKVSLGYRLKAFDDVNFNAGYSFAKRNANIDQNYLANSGNYALTTAVSSSALNGGNYLGYAAYPYANRNQNMVKTGVTWQATQKLDMGLNGRYTYDSYDQTLGVQSGRSTGVNFDTTYSYMEKGSISAYWSWQNGQRNLVSGASGNGASQTVAPRNIWANQLEDTGHAFGFLTKNGGLLNNKLEIIGDFSYSIDKSSYSTQVPYLATCGASGTLSCGDLSPIKNGLFSLKLTGNYTVHKNGRVALAYIYQQLSSNDYFYNGQQFGYTPNSLMPTGLQQQSYRANVVALSYNYNF